MVLDDGCGEGTATTAMPRSSHNAAVSPGPTGNAMMGGVIRPTDLVDA